MAPWIPPTPEAAELDPLVLQLMRVDSGMLSDVLGSSNSLSTSGKSRWRQFEMPSCENWAQKVLCVLAGWWECEEEGERARKKRQMVKQPKSITSREVLTLELLNGVPQGGDSNHNFLVLLICPSVCSPNRYLPSILCVLEQKVKKWIKHRSLYSHETYSLANVNI